MKKYWTEDELRCLTEYLRLNDIIRLNYGSGPEMPEAIVKCMLYREALLCIYNKTVVCHIRSMTLEYSFVEAMVIKEALQK